MGVAAKFGDLVDVFIGSLDGVSGYRGRGAGPYIGLVTHVADNGNVDVTAFPPGAMPTFLGPLAHATETPDVGSPSFYRHGGETAEEAPLAKPAAPAVVEGAAAAATVEAPAPANAETTPPPNEPPPAASAEVPPPAAATAETPAPAAETPPAPVA